MRGVLGFLYGVGCLLVAIVSAFVVGTTAVLPFVVVPRGRRERYTIRVAQAWSRWIIRWVLLARVQVTGRMELADDQGALVLCNHRSWVDPPLLIAWTRSQGLSKMLVFWIPFVGIYGWLTGAVFFDRSSMAQRKRARNETMWLIRQGARVHVFPEGTRTRDGELAKKVYLTLPMDCFEAGLPVVPCAVWGTECTLPTTRSVAVPFQSCRLDIGPPLFPKDFPDADTFAKACWAEVSRRVELLRAEEQTSSPPRLAASAQG